MEFILLVAIGLLALLGVFCCARWLFRLWGFWPPSSPTNEAKVSMPENDKSEKEPQAVQSLPVELGPTRAQAKSAGSGATRRPMDAHAALRTPQARFVLVGVIAAALLIPLFLVNDLVRERAGLYASVVKDISRAWGGRQQVTGPILLIPYTEQQIISRSIPDEKKNPTPGDEEYRVIKESHLVPGYFVLLPEQVDFTGKMDPHERQRGIYRSLVYTADLRVQGRFVLPTPETMKRIAPAMDSVDYARAYVVMGLSYPSALRTVGPMLWNKTELAAEPGTQPFSTLQDGFRIPVRLSPETREYVFSQNLLFNGSSGIRFTPVGGVTRISLTSPWPHPSFTGNILPVTRDISDKGFTAAWDIPSLARSYANFGTRRDWPDQFTSFAAGVELYESSTHYHLIQRSVKYGILFIGLTFLAFIIFELGLRACLHPVQYGLVGLSMVVFYLVLLSLSEHFSFLPSYAAASACTILMIAIYTGAALRSAKEGAGVGILLTALYILLYAILQMEDYALLMGTALVLAMLAALMVVTRNLAFEKR